MKPTALNLKRTLYNREQKRKAHFEAKRAGEKILRLEYLFMMQLFEDNDFSYLELYGWYVNQWRLLCEYLEKRLKYHSLNEDYFRIYSPIEK